jgi:Aspartyl protease
MNELAIFLHLGSAILLRPQRGALLPPAWEDAHMNRTILAVALVFLTIATAADKPTLKQLYDRHRWFDLRDAIKDQDAPPLYKGAVASALNHPKEAEKFFNDAIKLNPKSEIASEARDMLTDLYGRSGRYHEALHELDESLKAAPGRADLVNGRALYAGWAEHGDQSVAATRPSAFQGSVSRDGVVLPVFIHGKTAHWTLDTGANFSMISEKEAAMFGVAVDESSAAVADGAGGAAKIRTAVIDELSVGETRLRNVAFLVLSDSQEPMSDMQPGERGLIGIQIPFALQSLAWKSDGTFETGFVVSGANSHSSNLFFDGLTPVTRVLFDGKQLDFELDSGEQAGSQLWTPFADVFAALLKERGTKSKKQVTETGGSNERDIIELPEIQFRVGGFDATLRPARVFSKPVGNDFRYGHLGMDVLSQARAVRINFEAMTLELLPLQ